MQGLLGPIAASPPLPLCYANECIADTIMLRSGPKRGDLQRYCKDLMSAADSVEMPHHLFTSANPVRTEY